MCARLYNIAHTRWNISAGGGVCSGWFSIVIFTNHAKISLNTVSKRDQSNDTPLDIPSTFYGYPISVEPMILLKHFFNGTPFNLS